MRQPKLLRIKQFIGTRIPMSSSKWWAGVADGTLPPPIKLGPRTTCWYESDIDLVVAHGLNWKAHKAADGQRDDQGR